MDNGELALQIIYVDDTLIARSSLELISTLKDGLKREFEMTFLVLSIEYVRAARVLDISQLQHLESLLNRFTPEPLKRGKCDEVVIVSCSKDTSMRIGHLANRHRLRSLLRRPNT